MSDLIRRQDAIDALRTCYDTEAITYTNGNEYIDYDQALDLINTLTSADRTGKWVDDNGRPYNGKPNNSCWCSECGEWLVASDEYSVSTNFCPNCGARMLNGGENERFNQQTGGNRSCQNHADVQTVCRR